MQLQIQPEWGIRYGRRTDSYHLPKRTEAREELAEQVGRDGARLIETIFEETAAAVAGVLAVDDIRIRWLGHWQQAELHITVAAQLPTAESHQIAETVRHALFHALTTLQEVTVHVDPLDNPSGSAHELTEHHTASN